MSISSSTTASSVTPSTGSPSFTSGIKIRKILLWQTRFDNVGWEEYDKRMRLSNPYYPKIA